MKLSKVLLILSGVAAVAVAGTVVVIRLVNGTVSDGDRPLAFAYMTPDELVVMREDKVLSRVQGVYDGRAPVVWTHSGLFVALLSTPPPSRAADRELIVVDARSGTQRREPCTGCADIVAVGENGIMTSTPDGQSLDDRFVFRRFDLDEPGPGVEVNLATGSGYGLVAGTRTYLLVSRGEYSRSGTYRQADESGAALHWVGMSDATSVKFGNLTDFKAVAAGATMQGNEMVAISYSAYSEYCDGDLRIHIVSSNGDLQLSDLSATGLPGFSMDLRDLWWGADERFHATLQAVRCDRSPTVPEPPHTLWALDMESMTWTTEGTVPARVVRYTGHGNAVLLKFEKCAENNDCPTGTLFRYTNGQRSPIAENVLSVSTQPSGGDFVVEKPEFSDSEVTCPAESRSGIKAGIRILSNPMTCADAQQIYSEYTHSPLPSEGNIAHIMTKEWSCATPTAGEVSRTGRIGSCEQPNTENGWSFIVVLVK